MSHRRSLGVALLVLAAAHAAPADAQVRDPELTWQHQRHAMGKKMLDAMGSMAPAFGMIGTLVGLVKMLANLSDPSSIGAGMAVALLTTFYGAVLAKTRFGYDDTLDVFGIHGVAGIVGGLGEHR